MRSRSSSRFRVRCPAQVQRGNQGPAARQRGLDPLPADAQVGVAAQPVRIDPAAFVGSHHVGALGHQIESGDGQYQTQPCERLGIAPLLMTHVAEAIMSVRKCGELCKRQFELCDGFVESARLLP